MSIKNLYEECGDVKQIKIKFVGFNDCPLEPAAFYNILNENYDIVETDNPDYIICSIFGQPYEYCKYPQVRIMYTGENYIPDFNLIDYALLPYNLKLYDRSFYYPSFSNNYQRTLSLSTIDRDYSIDFLRSKKYFANFISSHESEYGIRGDFFKALSNYKRVESPGTYLNNMPNGKTVKFMTDSKTNFQRNSKFSLCFESTKHNGFVTEKLMDALVAGSIPIYYGSETVTEIFNGKAFINCNDYNSFDDVIKKIIELDNNDEKYMEMLKQPILVDKEFPKTLYNGVESFFQNIFDQPLERCYRRARTAYPQYIEKKLNRKFNCDEKRQNMFRRIVKKYIKK